MFVSAKLALLFEQLELLAKEQFPTKQTSTTLQSIHFASSDFEPYIFYNQAKYTRNQIRKTDSYELILMCWQPGQVSPVHGHEGQKCWMRVIAGALTFNNFTDAVGAVQLEKVSTVVGMQGFVDGPAYIHSVSNLSAEKAISLHLYAHPFDQCDVYAGQSLSTKKMHLCYYSINGKVCQAE